MKKSEEGFLQRGKEEKQKKSKKKRAEKEIEWGEKKWAEQIKPNEGKWRLLAKWIVEKGRNGDGGFEGRNDRQDDIVVAKVTLTTTVLAKNLVLQKVWSSGDREGESKGMNLALQKVWSSGCSRGCWLKNKSSEEKGWILWFHDPVTERVLSK